MTGINLGRAHIVIGFLSLLCTAPSRAIAGDFSYVQIASSTVGTRIQWQGNIVRFQLNVSIDECQEACTNFPPCLAIDYTFGAAQTCMLVRTTVVADFNASVSTAPIRGFMKLSSAPTLLPTLLPSMSTSSPTTDAEADLTFPPTAIPTAVPTTLAPTTVAPTYTPPPDLFGFCGLNGSTFDRALGGPTAFPQDQFLPIIIVTSVSECAARCGNGCTGFVLFRSNMTCRTVIVRPSDLNIVPFYDDVFSYARVSSSPLCTFSPTMNPTRVPTLSIPTAAPSTTLPTTSIPTALPTTIAPTSSPTTSHPTYLPSGAPTTQPTLAPTESNCNGQPDPAMCDDVRPEMDICQTEFNTTCPLACNACIEIDLTDSPSNTPTVPTTTDTSTTETTTGTTTGTTTATTTPTSTLTTTLATTTVGAQAINADDDGVSLSSSWWIIVVAVVFVAIVVIFVWRFTKSAKEEPLVKNENFVDDEVFDEPINPIHVVGTGPRHRLPMPAKLLDPSRLPPVQSMKVSTFTDAEFMAVPQNAATIEEIPGNPRVIVPLNRYRNILPNQHTRVQLQEKRKDPVTTYINANFVVNAYDNPNGYIATQGPKPETADDFWRMIWEQGSTAIVMITGLKEGGREKCYRYWPESTELPETHGDFTVAVLNVQPRGDYTETTLTLAPKGTKQGRTIKHFWYTAWPDHGVPTNTEGAVDMLAAVEQYSNNADQPWVVHCSAGVGRTGTFIGIDTGIHLLNAYGKVDVLGLVKQMRSCRGQMVQSPYQARFMGTVLKKYADKFNEKRRQLSEESGNEVEVLEDDPNIITSSHIGYRVDTKYGQAILRFVGPHVQTYHQMVGVELETTQQSGTDGTLDNHRYFTCDAGMGMFLDINEVKKTDDLDYPDSDRESNASFEDLMAAAGSLGTTVEEDADMIVRDPLWLHNMIPRAMVEALIRESNMEPGTFLVKRRHESNTFELALVGEDGVSITYHKIKRSAISGKVVIFAANWTEFEECNNVNELVKSLATPNSKWSVILKGYVPRGRLPGDDSPATTNYVISRISRSSSDGSLADIDESTPEPAIVSAMKQFPLWSSDLTRSQAEKCLEFSGRSDGTWLLRALPGENVGLTVMHNSIVSHHLIEFDDNNTLVNRKSVGAMSLNDVLNVLQTNPSSVGWPFALDSSKFLTPWKVGDLVSAPYSVNGKYYDCIIVDIIAAGAFDDIPVDLARVSYVGHTSEDDDCVPLPGLKPSTGRENPDFYHVGPLAISYLLWKQASEETETDRHRRLEKLHTEASLRPRVVELTRTPEQEFGIKIRGCSAGIFVTEATGLAADTRRIQEGLQITAIFDQEVKDESQVSESLASLTNCELTLKTNHEGYSLCVADMEAETQMLKAQKEAGFRHLVTDLKYTRVSVPPSGLVGLVLGNLEDVGNFVTDVKAESSIASCGTDVVGLKLMQVESEDISLMSKKEALSTIASVQQILSNEDMLNIFFAVDKEGFKSLLDQRAVKRTPASLTPNPAFVAEPASIRVPMSNITGFSIDDVGKKALYAPLNEEGTIQFVGVHHIESKGERIGLAFESPIGKNNGSLESGAFKYFDCPPKCGIIAVPGKIQLVKKPNSKKKNEKKSKSSTKEVTINLVEGRKLGMSMADTDNGVEVTNISEKGLVYEEGSIKISDIIVSVNGVDTTSATKKDCVTAIKASKDKIAIGVKSPNKSRNPNDKSLLASTSQSGGSSTSGAGNTKLPTQATVKVESASKAVKKVSGKSDKKSKKRSNKDSQPEKKIQVVSMIKIEGTKIGLGIDETDKGLFVRSVTKGGLAYQAGGINPGMRIETLQEQDMNGKSKAELIALIKKVPSEIRLGLSGSGIPKAAGSAASTPSNSRPTTPIVDLLAPSPTPLIETNDSNEPTDQYTDMGKLALMKLLRTRNVDYKKKNGGTPSIGELRALARKSE